MSLNEKTQKAVNKLEKELLAQVEAEKKSAGLKKRVGVVYHISVPPQLCARVDRLLAESDYESYSQVGRVAIKRLCEANEKRVDAIRALETKGGTSNDPQRGLTGV